MMKTCPNCDNCRHYHRCKPYVKVVGVCPQYQQKADAAMIALGLVAFLFVLGILPLLIHLAKGI